MRILFDESVPFPLRLHLQGHEVETVQQLGWSGLNDGALLVHARKRFDLFITADRNLRYQQNLSGLELAILVLPSPSWPRLQCEVERICEAVGNIQSGEIRELPRS